ncbi:hypothetical protein COU58_03995 [Candidatus Pacearchaeota archaeon CG10_big_fil_rev_8_21_14_0_10_32_42]|nr:MAG: hypothetical protein COU58_03995 [Candidatus Pacearchaeota archaeon CG10_big_fil_rev_8_21_14_0_10_32_42]
MQKSLTFRVLLEPYEVYAQGVTEWEALDEIKLIQFPNQMLWSLFIENKRESWKYDDYNLRNR